MNPNPNPTPPRVRQTRGWHFDGSPVVTHQGRKGCRWCKGPVKPPKRSFCSHACVHDWRLRTDPGYVRACVLRRDGGVCCVCGLHVERIRRIIGHAQQFGFNVEMLFIQAGIPTTWEADHIVPVAEGGGLCGLDNYRTLCRACHVAETARLRRRLAKPQPGS